MIQQPDAPRQFDICTGRDVGDFDLQTHSCIIKYIFPCVDIAGFARHVACGPSVDIYVRAFLTRRRRDAEAAGGADEAEGEGEGEARHLLACDRHVRRTRFPVEKPVLKTTQSKLRASRQSGVRHVSPPRRVGRLSEFVDAGRTQ